MDGQDHKKTTATSAVVEGHEGHGSHICHRCGWPFPNPHPSAKHRRAHRKVCGTIEGYKVVQSEGEEGVHLAVNAVDDQASDDDDLHSPSPKLAKENSSEANKSEGDVFSDAATGFSDSGLSSQRSEESFEAVKGKEKNADHEGGDGASQPLMADENAEELNGLKNGSQTHDIGVIKTDGPTEHVVHLASDVDAVNPPILDGLRDPGNPVKDDTSASANEKVVTNSVLSTESIGKSEEKVLAKEGRGHIEASAESTSVKNSEVGNKEMNNNVEVTSDGILEQARSKVVMPIIVSEATEINDELSEAAGHKGEDVSTLKVLDSGLASDGKSDAEPCLEHQAAPSPLDSDETRLKNGDKISDKGEQRLDAGEAKPRSQGMLSPEKEEQKVEYIEAQPVKKVGDGNDEIPSSEIENSQSDQQPKSTALLQVGSPPSLTNVVKVSEGVKKDAEITDEAAKCSAAIQHGPLKMGHKQMEEAKFKDEAVHSTTTVKSILDQEAVNDRETIKEDAEEGNSPERYLIENTKEKKKMKKKKKKRPYWVPFMCCSSVHRDL